MTVDILDMTVDILGSHFILRQYVSLESCFSETNDCVLYFFVTKSQAEKIHTFSINLLNFPDFFHIFQKFVGFPDFF